MNRLTVLLLALLVAVSGHAEPIFTWRAGEPWFRVDGVPRLLLGRNPAAPDLDGFERYFAQAEAAGERLMRIHICYLPPDEQPGVASAGMTWHWDRVFDAAERHHLAVIPVFAVWSDWNDGSNHELWHGWQKNPYNAANGGPGKAPADLLAPGACQTAWLKRLAGLVGHWSSRRCIVAWELFSELDLITGAQPEAAVAFAQAMAQVVRDADDQHRPLTLSLSAGHDWPQLWRSGAVDLVQVHPYGSDDDDNLDELIVAAVRRAAAAYGKPVLLGECGLNWRPPKGTLDAAARAEVGLRHAIWAALVSGAANARMFWWQDGYDQFEGVSLAGRYAMLGRPMADVVAEIDATGLAPARVEVSAGLFGAALASDTAILGWFRDRRCVAPDWPTAATADQSVRLAVAAGSWSVDLLDAATGQRVAQQVATADAGWLTLPLPTFSGSLVVRASRP